MVERKLTSLVAGAGVAIWVHAPRLISWQLEYVSKLLLGDWVMRAHRYTPSPL